MSTVSINQVNTQRITEHQYPQKNGDDQTKKYEDPLMQWPVRGLAYSNDIGVGIKEIAPKLGLLLWVPTLMYFGADIYDKYKNDETTHSPSHKRGLKAAIFQGIASVFFPIIVIHSGQAAASALGRYGKNGLSLDAQETADNFLLRYMETHKLHKFANNTSDYENRLHSALETYIHDKKGEYKIKNPLAKLYNLIFTHDAALARADETKLKAFIDRKIESVFKMREELLKFKKPQEMSEKLFREYNALLPEYKKQTEELYTSKAAKAVIKKFEKSQIFRNKLLKTIGGFIALGLLTKPIDIFVEKAIIERYVEPGLSKFG